MLHTCRNINLQQNSLSGAEKNKTFMMRITFTSFWDFFNVFNPCENDLIVTMHSQIVRKSFMATRKKRKRKEKIKKS